MTSATSPAPILLVGGSGVAGRRTAQYLLAAHPNAPLLIGGRDLAKSQQASAEIGNAEGVEIDLTAADLGLDDRPISAVAVLPKDEVLAGLRYAQRRRVPYLSISGGIFEIGPEVGAYMHNPDAAAVVLGAEWLVGATTVTTLEFAKSFRRLDDVTIGALVDEQDSVGPEAEADMERLTRTMPAAFTRRNRAFVWRDGDDAKVTFRAADGTEMDATGFSVYDVVGIATATDAPNVAFNLASGVSSSRRGGEPASTEIIVELAGEDHQGRPLRTRHAVIHPAGQMPLTGLGVALTLARLTGLDGNPPTPPGLYFPYQLLDSATYFASLARADGEIRELEVF